MVLFYAWTDAQLINYVNLKLNFYENTDTDLVILHLSRVSHNLVSIIQDSRIFRKVCYLELPPDYLERKRSGITEEVRALTNGSRMKHFFFQNFTELLGTQKYDILVTAAFWSESMYLYSYLRTNSLNIKVMLIEEGLSCYNSPKNWLFRTVPSLSLKGKFRELLYYGRLPRIAKKHTTGLYVYQPLISVYEGVLQQYQLPPIDETNNQRCFRIVEQMAPEGNEVYENRKIIYIADAPRTQMDEPYQYVYKMLDSFVDEDNAKDVVMKMHPLFNKVGDVFAYNYAAQMYLDSRKAALELITIHINLDNKIVIANSSSAIYNMINCMNQKPYIIFMHRICAISESAEEERNNQLVAKLQKIYSEPDKIASPKDETELREILLSFMKKIQREDINKITNQERGMNMTNLQKYNDAFMDSFELEESQLGADLKYQSIPQWDSVGHMQLIATLEDSFDIMFDTDDIIDFDSYEKGKEFMKKYQVEL